MIDYRRKCAAYRRTRLPFITAFAGVIGLLCAPPVEAQFFGTSRSPAPARNMVARMGIEMSESDARHGIAFRPFAPPRRIVAVALLAPFHGADERANRGIGFEYIGALERRYVLAQWPANGGNINEFAPFNAADGCAGTRVFARVTKPNGIVWSTPHGLIVTLQADGENDARTLRIEWRRLIRRGVCR